jgi:PadR family transcriptional regulator PadR
MMRMAPSNPAFMGGISELVILRVLQDREMYGYEIVQAIQVRTHGVLTLREGVVYPLLHTLEKDGWLKSRRASDGPRPKVYYKLTAGGKRRLAALSDDWSRLNGAVAAIFKGGAHAV